MNKENINMSFSHLLRESRNWIPGTSLRMTLESGRTLLELIMTLAVIGVLGMGAIKFYKHTVNKVKAQNTAKMIKTIAFERQNMALRQESNLETTVKGPHSALHVKNGTSGNHQSYFWVETTLSDKDFCDSLKDSGFIQAEFVEVDGVSNGNCRDNSKLAFYFKKNPNAQVYCPSHSTNCDTYGDATGCEEGYYLTGGVCESCPEHVATCEDENTHTSCEEGYELHWGECILPPEMCTTDTQCTICGTCDTETGYCKEECTIPEPDANDNCGNNECIVYDNATQSCQNACERKEYLESTGTQWIDTGYAWTTNSIKLDLSIQVMEMSLGTSWWGAQGPGDTNWSINPWTDGSSWWIWAGSSGKIFSHESSKNYVLANRLNLTYIANNSTVIELMNDMKNNTTYSGNLNASGSNMYIFNSSQNNSSLSRRSKMKLYYFKMWDNGTLVRDFIPVSSPKGNCMFDRVSEKLFCNQATSGPDFLTDLGDIK